MMRSNRHDLAQKQNKKTAKGWGGGGAYLIVIPAEKM